MTQAIRTNYDMAAERIASGDWTVDASLGLVCGKRGNPFRRTNSWGYIQIKFRDRDDWKVEHAALAHRVIWEHVHGPLSSALTINHLNGNKVDNRLANLEAVTVRANVRHSFETGLNAGRPGVANSRAVLTDDDVRTIYALAWAGHKQAEIGMRFGVGYSIVSNIKRGWAWTHITGHTPGADSPRAA